MFSSDYDENRPTYTPVALPSLTLLEREGTRAVYGLPGHAIAKPKVVVSKTSTGNGKKPIARSSVQVVMATTDATGVQLDERIVVKLEMATPIKGSVDDAAVALYTMKEILASEGFEIDALTSQHTPLDVS